MTTIEPVALGASHLDDENVILVQAYSADDDAETEFIESWGEVKMVGLGCVTAMPYPKNDAGFAQGFLADNLEGIGIVMNWRDPRVAQVYGQIQPGDAVFHGTGPNHQSQLRCQEQSVSIVVGNDCAVVVDRKNKKITITGFGHVFQITDDALAMAHKNGKHGINIAADYLHVFGPAVVLGGMVPNPALAIMTGPGTLNTATAPIALVPAKGVFLGL